MSQIGTDGLEIHYFDRDDKELCDRLSKLGYRVRIVRHIICVVCPKCNRDDHHNCWNTEHYKYCSCPPCTMGNLDEVWFTDVESKEFWDGIMN